MPFTSLTGRLGTFTLRMVARPPSVSGVALRRSTITLAKCAPVAKWRAASPRVPSVFSETATAALPRNRPSVAAATVPE
jgi:hypothetical protein